MVSIFMLSSIIAYCRSDDSIAQIDPKTTALRLDKLIEEEEKTLLGVKNPGPRLEYRLFELQSEKLKLRYSRDNETFIKQSLNSTDINEEKLFKNSIKLYLKIKKYGNDLLKKRSFPKRLKAQIHYTLALNSRDYYPKDKIELGHLLKARKLAHPHERVFYNISTAVAEHYYNTKRYKDAVIEYQKVLLSEWAKSDSWKTKHLYNYAWCMLKTQKFVNAIDLLELAHEEGQKSTYTDYSMQVLESLPIFYVLGEQIQRGIDFFVAKTAHPPSSLLKLAKKSSSKGFHAQTESILDLLKKKYADKIKEEEAVDIELFNFDFRSEYSNEEEKMLSAIKLSEHGLTEYQREEVIRKFTEWVNGEQNILKQEAKIYKKDVGKLRVSKVKRIFNLLIKIDPDKKADYHYYLAESLRTAYEYENSLHYYKSSLSLYKRDLKKNDSKIRDTMEAIFTSIDKAQMSEDRKDVELIFAYDQFATIWPNHEKTPDAFMRLFNLFDKRNEISSMESALDRYVKNNPKDIKAQRDLYRRLINDSLDKKQAYRLNDYLAKLKAGHLRFEIKEISQVESSLANLLFQNSIRYAQEKNYDKALEGLKKVYFDLNFPNSIKAHAAYFLGVFSGENNDPHSSLKWFKKGFPLLSQSDQLEKKREINKISQRLALIGDFSNAAYIQEFILDHFCESKKENESNLLHALEFHMANHHTLKSLHSYQTFKSCVNDKAQAQEKIIRYLFNHEDRSQLLSFLSDEPLIEDNNRLISDLLEIIYLESIRNNSLKQEVVRLAKVRNLRHILDMEEFESKFSLNKNAMNKLLQSQLVLNEDFSPESFKQDMSIRIREFSELINQRNELALKANPNQALLVIQENIRNYAILSKELRQYRLPELDMSKFSTNFEKTFSDQLNRLALSLDQKKAQQQAQGIQLISKTDVFPIIDLDGLDILDDENRSLSLKSISKNFTDTFDVRP